MLKKRSKHVARIALPKVTTAFFCANCGAASLDPNKICTVRGKGTIADWRGISDNNPPLPCVNRKNNIRWACAECSKVAVNAELLCEPQEMPQP